MGDVDYQQSLNAMHVPEDAGEHVDALRGILARIPDGWGRWISCSRGWYPLLVELDEQVRALLPNYVIHQVKEKFGGLRYYWEPGEEARDPSDPGGDAVVGGEAAVAERERRIELAQQLVDSAERRAGGTCELCGAAGQLHRTRAGRYKTLCQDCPVLCCSSD
jgi:RNA polymerase-binding transcription factor DksA